MCRSFFLIQDTYWHMKREETERDTSIKISRPLSFGDVVWQTAHREISIRWLKQYKKGFRLTIDYRCERQIEMMSSYDSKMLNVIFHSPTPTSCPDSRGRHWPTAHTPCVHTWVNKRKKHLRMRLCSFSWDNLRALFFFKAEALTKCKSNFRRMWIHEQKVFPPFIIHFVCLKILSSLSFPFFAFFGMNKMMTRIRGRVRGWILLW